MFFLWLLCACLLLAGLAGRRHVRLTLDDLRLDFLAKPGRSAPLAFRPDPGLSPPPGVTPGGWPTVRVDPRAGPCFRAIDLAPSRKTRGLRRLTPVGPLVIPTS